jgi:hypothetical protein
MFPIPCPSDSRTMRTLVNTVLDSTHHNMHVPFALFLHWQIIVFYNCIQSTQKRPVDGSIVNVGSVGERFRQSNCSPFSSLYITGQPNTLQKMEYEYVCGKLQSDIIISRDREAGLLTPLLHVHMKDIYMIIWKRPEVRNTNSQEPCCSFIQLFRL